MLRIQSCHKVEIYVLAPVGHVSITDCIDCTIIIGATERSIVMKDCSQINLIATCGSLTVWYFSLSRNAFCCMSGVLCVMCLCVCVCVCVCMCMCVCVCVYLCVCVCCVCVVCVYVLCVLCMCCVCCVCVVYVCVCVCVCCVCVCCASLARSIPPSLIHLFHIYLTGTANHAF